MVMMAKRRREYGVAGAAIVDEMRRVEGSDDGVREQVALAPDGDFDADLTMRAPMSDVQFRTIEALVNRESPWNEHDMRIASGYVVTLYLEVKRLRQEAKQRENDLEAAVKIVSQVATARDRLRDVLDALGGDA